MYALAGDTDGIDGAEEIAGAIVTPDTLRARRGAGIDAKRDAWTTTTATASSRRSATRSITGPTLTNVNDFRAILINAEPREAA